MAWIASSKSFRCQKGLGASQTESLFTQDCRYGLRVCSVLQTMGRQCILSTCMIGSCLVKTETSWNMGYGSRAGILLLSNSAQTDSTEVTQSGFSCATKPMLSEISHERRFTLPSAPVGCTQRPVLCLRRAFSTPM